MMRSYVILFDVDSVLSDWNHRRHHYDDPATHELGNELLPNDDPIPAGVVLYNMLLTQAQIISHAIVHANMKDAEIPYVDVITCRPERMRQATMEWFVKNGLLAPRSLHMRDDLDTRPHAEIKWEMYETYYKGKEECLVLFEDNPETTQYFRERGVTVYQVC